MKRCNPLVVLILSITAWVGQPAQEALAQPPRIMPAKEKTWVRTLKGDLTREQLNKKDEAPKVIKIDEAYRKTLLTPANTPSGVVKDSASCKEALAPLEKKRKLLQRDGGMWHAFERAAEVRPFSNKGMQLDSNINKIGQALRHLCATADGVPKAPLARMVTDLIRKHGKEGARAYLLGLGQAPEHIDNWFEFTELSEKMATRKVPYAKVEDLLRKAQTLLNGYEGLYNEKVSGANKEAFLSRSKTLLAAINHNLENVPEFAMALKEDLAKPHVKFEGDKWK